MLDNLPVQTCVGRGVAAVKGLTPEMVRDVLIAAGVGNEERMELRTTECTCRLKSAFVPACREEEWGRAGPPRPSGRRLSRGSGLTLELWSRARA